MSLFASATVILSIDTAVISRGCDTTKMNFLMQTDFPEKFDTPRGPKGGRKDRIEEEEERHFGALQKELDRK